MALIRRRKIRKGSKKSKRGGASKSKSKSRSSKLSKLKAFLKTPRGKMALASVLGTGALGLGYHYRNPIKSAASSAKHKMLQIKSPIPGFRHYTLW